MLSLLGDYRRGAIRLSTLVTDLEGLLDAAGGADRRFVERWYELWTPLEIRNALVSEGMSSEPRLDEIASDLKALEQFLAEHLGT